MANKRCYAYILVIFFITMSVTLVTVQFKHRVLLQINLIENTNFQEPSPHHVPVHSESRHSDVTKSVQSSTSTPLNHGSMLQSKVLSNTALTSQRHQQSIGNTSKNQTLTSSKITTTSTYQPATATHQTTTTTTHQPTTATHQPTTATHQTTITTHQTHQSSIRSIINQTKVQSSIQSNTSHVPAKSFYICTPFVGRLGNHMFLFASGYGIALYKNMKMVVGQKDLINRIFNLKENDHLVISKDKHECAGSTVISEAQGCAFDPKIKNFKPDHSYTLRIYLQSRKYFNESSEEIRKQLVFREPVPSQVKHVIGEVVKKHSYRSREEVVLISIHIRRGDMVGNSFGYQVATNEYIEKAMNQFKNISNKIFLVCSDAIIWCKNNIPKDKGAVEFMTGNSRQLDMAILSSCDHIITTVGSYSWWAGWLSKGKVLYYKWPAREGSPLRRQFSSDFKDYFYPNWTGL